MTQLKCPQCGKTADAPEEIVEHGEKCYSCNVPLVLADEREAERRSSERMATNSGIIGGSLLGAVGTAFVSIHARDAAISIIGGTFGALLGAIVGQILSYVAAFLLVQIDHFTIGRLSEDATTTHQIGNIVTVVLMMAGCAVGVGTDIITNAAAGMEPIWFLAACAGLVAGACIGYSIAKIVHSW